MNVYLIKYSIDCSDEEFISVKTGEAEVVSPSEDEAKECLLAELKDSKLTITSIKLIEGLEES